MNVDKILFKCVERRNTFVKGNKEWALNCCYESGNYWTITTFTKEPTEKHVSDIIEIILRSMEFYHKSVIPKRYNKFNFEFIKEE